MINDIFVSVSTNRDEVEVGKEFEVRLIIPKTVGNCSEISVLFNRYGEEPTVVRKMQKSSESTDSCEFSAKVSLPLLGNYYYFFKVIVDGAQKAIKISRETGKPFITMGESPYWNLFVIQKELQLPEWTKSGAIYYQIFVDRFFGEGKAKCIKIEGRNYRNWGDMPDYKRNEEGYFHNNDFFLGNLEGIRKRLKYFKKLGATALYLSPINYSRLRYDRYAVTDYRTIDPNVGDFEDLRKLHDDANKNGMKIVLDIAFNHCGSDNPIFQEAISNPNSKYRKWFYINDDGTYRYWYDEFKDMPIFNQKCKEYQEYIFGKNGVVELFADYVDGFRLDVSEELIPEVLEGIRNKANEKRKHIIIGECWHKVPLERLGTCIDAPTNYLFTDALYKLMAFGDFEYFKWQIEDVISNYPEETVCSMLNSLDTHDTVRALTILGGKWMRHDIEIWKIDEPPSPWHKYINGRMIFLTDVFREDEFQYDKLPAKVYREAKKQLKALSVVLYFLPGAPCIFYGSEVGLHGYKDPFNRKCFPWGHLDKDLLKFFRKLGKVRRKNEEQLCNKKIRIYDFDNRVLRFERNNLFIIVNFSNLTQEMRVPEEYLDAEHLFEMGVAENSIKPYGAIVMRKRGEG